MATEVDIVVRYKETDQMGIVHHSNFVVWFELGRTDLLRKQGMSYHEVEGRLGLLLPVIHLDVDYHQPARYGDDIVVRTRIAKLTGVRIQFAYEVYRRGEGNPLVTGSTHHAWVDKNMKPVRVDRRFPELYQMLSRAAQD